jgi:nucleoside-diphosphate-sugar epimerase
MSVLPEASPPSTDRRIRTAFVTGATGLLGNNLVRDLLAQGVAVKALARSATKAQKQFAGLENVDIVVGDLADIDGFAAAMRRCDVVFHTAAFFRESYSGGRHTTALTQTNVTGTTDLLRAAYAQDVRRFVHISSIAVLRGERGAWVDETQLRETADADDYYRSKILADRAVLDFLDDHPNFDAVFVLPGWMWGPGDAGPTMSGQFVLDILHRKLPGIVAGSVSLVDARDVAKAARLAALHGRRGERYLAAGRHIAMDTLVPLVGNITGVQTPTRRIPLGMLFPLAWIQEAIARLTGKPALLSLATIQALRAENERSRFNPEKAQKELGLTFRAMAETIADTAAWYRKNGY